MKKWWPFFVVLIILVGCDPKSNDETLTPVPTVAGLNGQPIPVAFSELAANPTVFEDAYIQLTGRYTRLPLLVCESKSQRSPATWGLTSNTLLALAGGFDGQLRPLLPDNLTMTVAGRWQHWQGEVGCGDTAQSQDVWYLAVSHIISPNPIAQVTLTPGGILFEPIEEETAVSPLPTDVQPDDRETVVPLTQPPIQPSDPGTTPTTSATSTPILRPTINQATPTLNPQIPTNTPTIISTRLSASPTSNPQVTPTPSNTPLPGATPTNIPTAPPNATATDANNINDIDMGFIDLEELFMERLNVGNRHVWTFENEIANNTLEINAASTTAVDIAITIMDSNGSVLVSQNEAVAGQIELITNFALDDVGEYQIAISTANNVSGDYGLLILDDISFPITTDVIAYNSPVSTSFNENIEQIWFFTGTINDSVSITANPDDNADIGVELIGPGADPLENLDEFLEGVTEELLDYPLPETGLYALWLYGISDVPITVDLFITDN